MKNLGESDSLSCKNMNIPIWTHDLKRGDILMWEDNLSHYVYVLHTSPDIFLDALWVIAIERGGDMIDFPLGRQETLEFNRIKVVARI